MLIVNNLIKYVIMFLVVFMSTFYIPNCSIMNEHAIYIGLLASTTFVLLDRCLPNLVYMDKEKNDEHSH